MFDTHPSDLLAKMHIYSQIFQFQHLVRKASQGFSGNTVYGNVVVNPVMT